MSRRKPAKLPAGTAGRFIVGEAVVGLLEPGTCGHLLARAADITLVLDAGGTVRDLAFGSEALATLVGTGWLGQHLSELVAPDSRPKVAAMLAEAPGQAPSVARQLNHALPGGDGLPVLYTAQALPAQGRQPARWLLFGRDQRIVAALQQRLVEAQLSMERDYARFRQAELRYRHLFQVASEGVLVLDPATTKVLEANPAAAQLLGVAPERLTGQSLAPLFSAAAQSVVAGLLATLRRAGRADALTADLADGHQRLQLSASLIHQEDTHLLMVRLTAPGDKLPRQSDRPSPALIQELAQAMPDAMVVTDLQGQLVAANRGFEALSQTTGAAQWQQRSLAQWLGRGEVDLAVLLSNLRQRGAVRLYATSLRGEFGASTDVEISAVQLSEAGTLGFVVRDIGRRLAGEPGPDDAALPRSVNKLAELVGRVPMKDIVADTTDMIEKRCIEAALELTRDNRASAAEILGLSRQSLYVKMRRYGLGDLGSAAQD
jgi:transcriptional regulator PpsR